MPPSRTSTVDILRRAEETLKTAGQGLDDLINGPQERKLSGFRNLIVFGRAVTNILQSLRSTEPSFDNWYGKYKEEMENDPLMRYFYDLRSKILKEGLTETGIGVYIKKFEYPADLARFGPPPPNAKGLFIGDNLGGSGWEVELQDGSIEKYYVELPSDIGTADIHFVAPPRIHLGKKITDTSVENLSKLYIDYLRRLVLSATRALEL